MLYRGIDIDFRREEYECLAPFSCIIIHDRAAIVKLLLERGANPYIKPCGDRQGVMLLYIAAVLDALSLNSHLPTQFKANS